ncbi:hypothetical protein [Anaerolactibacter massiliensis]|uniref:hypothetical protein n=1 Tax=Anaerolactibacter massiliensis TaxID=2044573 RepID=UPI000CF87D5A|nr:hypothetical protein [Anaerolactibacter massiliensis]
MAEEEKLSDNEELVLSWLKVDLAKPYASSDLSAYLKNLIKASEEMIARTGITLDLAKISDQQLLEAYAAWLYRKRASGESGQPRMLQIMLRDRLFSEKGSASDDTTSG